MALVGFRAYSDSNDGSQLKSHCGRRLNFHKNASFTTVCPPPAMSLNLHPLITAKDEISRHWRFDLFIVLDPSLKSVKILYLFKTFTLPIKGYVVQSLIELLHSTSKEICSQCKLIVLDARQELKEGQNVAIKMNKQFGIRFDNFRQLDIQITSGTNILNDLYFLLFYNSSKTIHET